MEERTDTTREFFDGLAARRSEPLLHGVTGTIRFDLTSDEGVEHWLVHVREGDVKVSRRNAKADCVAAAERGLFDRLVIGEVNAVAAVLRSELRIDGQAALLLAFQRLLPGPPGSARDATSDEGRRR
ncbi:MAG TPA: SCP2 sterol-binding domain-containing protein [Actinomycetota bacterium]|nr:SCP2 sterol-binding domain-containing protein [Actinomycetota bacterium]